MRPVALSLLLLSAVGYGFQLNSHTVRPFRPTRFSRPTSKLDALSPEHATQLAQDIHSIVHGQLQHAWLADHGTSMTLADAAAGTLDVPPIDLTDQVAAEVVDAVQSATDAAVEAAAASDGGWWETYVRTFESALKAVHGFIDEPLRNAGITQTWGISIAIFTASARTLLVPLSVQQSKSTEYNKFLQPYIKEIKKKFADNQDMQNRAIGKLYEDAQQNPLSGCLFSLAQLPILLGLYRGVRRLAQDGQLDEPFLWIPSLAGPVSPPDYRGVQWLTEGWTNVDGAGWTPSLGWETTLAFLVMPVLLVCAQSFTMRVLTPEVDEEGMSDEEKEQLGKTQLVLKFLPLLIGFFSLQVPAGLTIYWMTTNIFSLSQSLAVRAYYAANPPEIELPEYWDALDNIEGMSVDEKREAAKAGLAVGPTMQDLMDASKFHVVVERKPLRLESTAWDRVSKLEEADIPAELESWAGASKLSFKVDEINHEDGIASSATEETKEKETQVS